MVVHVHAGSRDYSVSRVSAGQWETTSDVLAVEEPLEIRIVQTLQGQEKEFSLSITMRTPGEDAELVLGFLLTEGLIRSPDDVIGVRPCQRRNVVRVRLAQHVQLDPDRLRRHFYTSSSCGVCGKTSIDAVQMQIDHSLAPLHGAIPSETIHHLPEKLRAAQLVFQRTGGLHASGLFTLQGDLILLREDVGRHNALDKLIGAQSYADEAQLLESILLVSGRASFELVQKALIAGIPAMAAVGAPSSLAMELAERHDMTLMGFVRHQRFNVYCGSHRLQQSGNVDGVATC